MRQFVREVIASVVAAVLFAGAVYLVAIFQESAFDGRTYAISVLAGLLGIALLLVGTLSLKLKELGIRRLVSKADDTKMESVKRASESYVWIGTSSHWMLGDSNFRDYIIEKKPKVAFTFGTIDPACDYAIRQQKEWQGQHGEELEERVKAVPDYVAKLRKKHRKIAGFCVPAPAIFRVAIVDDERVYVSCYEHGCRGPEAKQLVLSAKGLLGRWFVAYYTRMRSFAEACGNNALDREQCVSTDADATAGHTSE